MSFLDATAVQPLGDGVYAAEVHPDWQALNGPNGGYVAGIMARALRTEVDDRQRSLRSITVHYLSAAKVGPASVHVTVERRGRSVVSTSARLQQGSTTVALALAVFSPAWDGLAYSESPLPTLPPAASLPRFTPPPFAPLPIFGVIDVRLPEPLPLSGGDRGRVAGWLRPDSAEPIDEVWLVTAADALPPAVFGRLATPVGAPTLDLTVHIRTAHPQHHLSEGGFVGAEFLAPVSQDGLMIEDGTLWAADGTLLAQSRQLAIVR